MKLDVLIVWRLAELNDRNRILNCVVLHFAKAYTDVMIFDIHPTKFFDYFESWSCSIDRVIWPLTQNQFLNHYITQKFFHLRLIRFVLIWLYLNLKVTILSTQRFRILHVKSFSLWTYLKRIKYLISISFFTVSQQLIAKLEFVSFLANNFILVLSDLSPLYREMV